MYMGVFCLFVEMGLVNQKKEKIATTVKMIAESVNHLLEALQEALVVVLVEDHLEAGAEEALVVEVLLVQQLQQPQGAEKCTRPACLKVLDKMAANETGTTSN